MGLFDSYYDPQTYSGGGGLIDRLLTQLDTQGQYQPAIGFPQSPMDANAAAPASQPQAPQNAPIMIGGYAMPRVGSGFQDHADAYVNDGTPLPPQTAAERAAGVLPGNLPAGQPQPQAPDLPATKNVISSLANTGVLSAVPNLGNHLMAGYENMRHGGGLLGSVVAAVTGQRNDPQAEQLQQQQRLLQQRYLAFKAAGIPEQKAVLAAIDPESEKVIVGDQFGPDQYSVVQTGENALGGKSFQLFNKHTGDLKPIIGASSPGDAGAGLGNMDLTGKDYLASLPKAQANTVQGMVDGTIPPPSSFAMSKPYWQNMIAAAKNYDPTFDATNWSGRVTIPWRERH